MRTESVGVVVVLLTLGCASGLNTGEQALESSVIVDASSEIAGAPSFDKTCLPVSPNSICQDYHQHNPEPWPEGGLVQYFIRCDAGFINWDNCTAWSYNPSYYSTDTWAFCCFPPDASALR